MDTEALDRAERWITKIVDGIDTVSGVIENVSCKIIKTLDDFAEALFDEIAKAREAHDDEVAACMAAHPAGKGRVNNDSSNTAEPTREEKLKAIQDWYLKKGGLKDSSIWFTNPDSLADLTINAGYEYVAENP